MSVSLQNGLEYSVAVERHQDGGRRDAVYQMETAAVRAGEREREMRGRE